jgi:endogenous inhibitor of DNA gyrase (YacG/DUF329 family)
VSYTTVYDVTCAECGAESVAAVTVWPGTRWDPPDGETTPEECPQCGKPFDDTDAMGGVRAARTRPQGGRMTHLAARLFYRRRLSRRMHRLMFFYRTTY